MLSNLALTHFVAESPRPTSSVTANNPNERSVNELASQDDGEEAASLQETRTMAGNRFEFSRIDQEASSGHGDMINVSDDNMTVKAVIKSQISGDQI